ncbi:hypothetical protein F0562_012245 [Nyssa sinensis]|uniref:Receptor-like serine/threonine-protein kinase n=1 Tax=Nyssa sinensis TaxID=561372 RepID=A0A5J4ZVX0_9ASTE|nr:hypothetical protein F0562_012245 [Nyssa sinensis]
MGCFLNPATVISLLASTPFLTMSLYFFLLIIHLDSSTVVWSANRATPVLNSDNFVFDDSGNAYLESGGSTVWSADTAVKGVSAMEMWDSGNLVLLGNDSSIIWQSFSHPTDTLLSNQNFTEGMRLVSNPNPNNLSYFLEIKSGDMILSVGFPTPQPYWTMGNENRKTINQDGGEVRLASLSANSWRFYDPNRVLLWQFIFSDNTDPNATWVAVVGSDGFITFSNLQVGGPSSPSQTEIPSDQCSRPGACDAYFVCSSGNMCQCLPVLSPHNCKPGFVSPCNSSKHSIQLVNAGDGLNYIALGFIQPSSRTDLESCKTSCLANCSCLALFFENSSRNCFLLDGIGSLQNNNNGGGFVSYIKVLNSTGDGGGNTGGGGSSHKRFPFVIIIAICTVLVILGLLYAGFRYCRRKRQLPESPKETSEEDNFLENLSGMPIHFSYKDLQTATNDFSVKLGQGGFGSVYQGVLPDGTRVAVKKLEGLGQGKKEFRAEVSTIGSIHHNHLVKLKGFCAEGKHRLLAYEYMAKGSLDKWIFRKNKEDLMLDWETRFKIALDTAKGLAYLHEDSKLMTREQSHVFTTLRGTRGYLAPEWITSYAISEKSDVYSYGMVLLEIIGGRKNYDPTETSEKSHFPLYAFKMMEEGKLRNILDSKLKIDEDDERVSIAIKVALWCIHDDTYLRPPMTKVVQMLEGLCAVPPPPTSSKMGSHLYAGFFKVNK